MDRKTATLIGAAAALATAPGLASATPTAGSYADLLQPIPNAVQQLKLSDAELAANPPARLIRAQYDQHHHHHHHHHHHSRRWYRTHGYVWLGGAWVLRPAHHHHHHHNHDHN